MNEKTNFQRIIQNAGLQITSDMSEAVVEQIVNQFMTIAKANGLTIRQAQKIFRICSEYVLDCTLV